MPEMQHMLVDYHQDSNLNHMKHESESESPNTKCERSFKSPSKDTLHFFYPKILPTHKG